jgi:hypothetical protein
MASSSKTGSKTAPRRTPSKAKPTRSRKATSSGSSSPKASRTASASSGGAASPTRASASKPASPGKPERLSAGGLDPLVLDYLKKNKATAPHTPGQVAKGLGRSSGAVGNCLARLTDAKKTKRVSDKPQQYALAA